MAVEITISYNTRNHEGKESHLVKDNRLPNIQDHSFFMIHDPRTERDYYVGEHPSKMYGVVFESQNPVSISQRIYRLLRRNKELRLIHKITPSTPWPETMESGDHRISPGIENAAVKAIFLPPKSRQQQVSSCSQRG